MKQNEAKCGGTSFGLLISYVYIGEVGDGGRKEERETALSELSNRFHDLIENLVNLLKHLVV